jgi:RNA-directed DNA polymerase
VSLTGSRRPREFPTVEFERYADDVVVHCATECQARQVLAALGDRMEEVGLCLHPAATKVVYCEDGRRRGAYPHTSFTFLGFTFRPRGARNPATGQMFLSFVPAISKDALNKISRGIGRWRLHRRIGFTFAQLAKAINPVLAGWMQYYGRFCRSALYPLLMRVNAYLVRWIRDKYERLRSRRKALRCMRGIAERYPRDVRALEMGDSGIPGLRTKMTRVV